MSTPSVNVKIWLALEDAIKDHADTNPVAWPAQFYEPTNKWYYRVAFVPVQPESVFIEDDTPHVRTGALIVTVVWPIISGYNVAIYEETAGKVAAYFSEGSSFRFMDVCVSINGAPTINPGYEDNGYWTIPVSIPWRCCA